VGWGVGVGWETCNCYTLAFVLLTAAIFERWWERGEAFGFALDGMADDGWEYQLGRPHGVLGLCRYPG
jgi:hypothetical protein